MPNWKKVVVSGSDAILNNITASTGIEVGGNILPDSDNTLSLGSTSLRFQLNGGTPVTVTGSGTANTITRFQSATTVEDSNIFSSDTLTRITHGNDGNTIFLVSGSNGELLSVSDDDNENIFRVNDGNGLAIFEISSSGYVEVAGDVTASNFFLDDFGNLSASLADISSSAGSGNIYNANGTVSSNRTINGGSNSINFNNFSAFSITNSPITLEAPFYYTALPVATGSALDHILYIDTTSGEVKYSSSLDLQGVTDQGSTTTNAITASAFSGSLIRLSEGGTGMRITNVGGFEPQSGTFNIFGNNDVTFGAGGSGEASRVLTLRETSFDAHFTNDVVITGSITGSGLFLGDYAENQSNRLTINNGSDATVVRAAHATYCGVIVDYTIYSTDAERSNQRTGTYRATFNGSEVQDSETMTNDIGNTNGFVLSTSLDGTNFTLTANNDIGQQCRVSYTTKLIRV